MNKQIKYVEETDAPDDVRESFDRAVILPTFEVTPEGVREFAARREKKTVSIYLSVDTIEKFKKAAQETGGRYQTMISNVLDTYTQQHLS